MTARTADPLDAELARLADGDRAVFHSLYGSLWPIVRAFCARALRGERDADDAAQEVMVKLFAEAPRYERERPAIAWALAIAAWECRTIAKRAHRRREEPADFVGVVASAGPDPEELASRSELLQAARDALAGLSPTDRELLEISFLAAWDERTAPRDASFRKRKERALTRLREAFRRVYGS